MGENVVLVKSKGFAIRIIRLFQYLKTEKREFVLSEQVLRSGTSIGANVREGINGVSAKEFIHKLNIALKEAKETEYWLELLHETDYISLQQFQSLQTDCAELIALLTSIIKTMRQKTTNTSNQ